MSFFFALRGSTAEDAAQDVINVQIPALRELCTARELSIDNVDVFCEKGVFDTDTSRRILKAGQDAGWKLNFHGDELHAMNSGEVSVRTVTHTHTHTHTHTNSLPHTYTHKFSLSLYIH